MASEVRRVGKVTALRRKGEQEAGAPATDEAAQPAEAPDTMVLRVVLVFTVDGKPVANVPFVAELERPAADQGAQLQIALDSRVLLQMLEPHLGPSAASASVAKPKVWTPGQ